MGRQPICIKCGEIHDRGDSLTCNECRKVTCYDCGCEISPGEAIEWDGEYYCRDCREMCERCGDAAVRENMIWISDREEYWCEYCADNYAFQCDDCGEYYSRRGTRRYYAVGDRTICENCIEDYVLCDECDQYVRYDDAEQIGDRWYCPDCAEEIRERKEEESA
jgi:formylmethanofuran dehydrogenase subunit E